MSDGDRSEKGSVCSIKSVKSSKHVIQKNCEKCEERADSIRVEQKAIAGRIAGLECDFAEHRLVLDSLANIDEKRKCYRMTGGVLVQMTVEEVLPTLKTNKDLLSQTITNLMEALNEKGREMMECHETSRKQHHHGDSKEAHNKDGPHKDGQNKECQNNDSQNKEGPDKDSHNKDGKNEDNRINDGPHKDGQSEASSARSGSAKNDKESPSTSCLPKN